MRVYITNINGQSMQSTAQIAQNMVTDIATQLGYRELGIYCYNMNADSEAELSKRLDGIIAGLRHGDVVIFQSPTWNTTAFDEKVMYKLRLLNIKIIIMIHDVVPLMFSGNYYLMERTINYYNQADLVIVPSQAMLERLRQEGLTVEKTIIQRMWDHPSDLPMHEAQFDKVIHFPGSPDRFSFVKSWSHNLPLYLYAHQDIDLVPNVIKQPWMREEQLQMTLSKGGFGLIWMDEHDFDYMTMYCPYKLGMFMAAGIPVVVHKAIANSDIIEKNQLGFVVFSLDEAVNKIEAMTEVEYRQFVEQVRDFNRLVRYGYFTRRLLTEAVFQVLQA